MNLRGCVIIKFVELKSKMYFTGAKVGKKVKKGKGINKNVVEKIRDVIYEDFLLNSKIKRMKRKQNEKNSK